MRLFVGLPLAKECAHVLAHVGEANRNRFPLARWSSPEMMHITLSFLGTVAEERVSHIIAALEEVQVPSFEVQICDTGGFERAGVLFAEVDLSARLAVLVSEVTERLSSLGFPPERRPFRPHVTLARMRGPLPRQPGGISLQGFRPLRFPADRFVLYRSHTSAAGATYEVLREFELQPV